MKKISTSSSSVVNLKEKKKDRRVLVLFLFAALVLCFTTFVQFFPKRNNGGEWVVCHDNTIIFASNLSLAGEDEGMQRLQSCAPLPALLLNQPFPINCATAEDLALISGIGPKLAEKITTYRKENGRFSSADDLLAVPGIGPAIMENFSLADFSQ